MKPCPQTVCSTAMNPAKATSQKRRADEKAEGRLNIRDLKYEGVLSIGMEEFMEFAFARGKGLEVVRELGFMELFEKVEVRST